MDDNKNAAPEASDDAAQEVGQDASPTVSPYFGSVKEMMSRYSHCTICGANLHFTHMTDFSRNLTQEIAKCPECGVRARNVMHRLQ